MLIHRKCGIYLSVLIFSSVANSEIQKTIFDAAGLSQNEQKDLKDITEYQQRRFRQYENNTLLLDYVNGSKVDKHIDAKLSIAYLLTAPDRVEYDGKEQSDWNLAFSASVEFDFFMATRHSGPVVGRRYNPGLQYYYSMNKTEGWQEYRFSIEHESNGQATESRATLNRITNDFLAEYADTPDFDLNKASELAEETISMGNNFVSVGGVFRFNNQKLNTQMCDTQLSCFDIHIKLRDNTLITDENSGNFRSLEAEDQNLSEYQGISLSYLNRFDFAEKQDITIELNYVTGQINGGKPGKHNTFKANIYYNWKLNNDKLIVPLVASCQTGYMHDLYNFAQKKTECTFGFHFIY